MLKPQRLQFLRGRRVASFISVTRLYFLISMYIWSIYIMSRERQCSRSAVLVDISFCEKLKWESHRFVCSRVVIWFMTYWWLLFASHLFSRISVKWSEWPYRPQVKVFAKLTAGIEVDKLSCSLALVSCLLRPIRPKRWCVINLIVFIVIQINVMLVC